MPDLDDIHIQREDDESLEALGVELVGEQEDLSLGAPVSGRPAEGETGGRGLLFGVLAVLMLAVMAAGVYWFWLREPSVPELGLRTPERSFQPSPAEALESAASDLSERLAEEPAWELPSLGASDAVVRTLVSALSSHPKIAGWLVNDRLVERFVRVVANVAFDEDPRSHLPFLRPDESFGARPSGEGWVVDPASYRRFLPLVEAFLSIDTAGASELYRRFQPLVDESYAELGYPGSFDGALGRAVERVLTLPGLQTEPEVTPWIHSFRFVDSELEALAPFQKLLLRMGPENLARIQRQVRNLHAAL